MGQGTIKIATCQFAVGSSIKRNSGQICGFIEKAAKAGAEIVHFSESALSGYAGVDFPNFVDYGWDLLERETERIRSAAAKGKVWVVLGSAHRSSNSDKPHQSLYLIGPDGKIAERYDKRFCMKAEMNRYTPGNRFMFFTINGVKC